MLGYWVDAVTGEITNIFDGAPPAPDGKVLITVQAPDNTMTWNFTTSSWYWSKRALLLRIIPKYQILIGTLGVNYGGQNLVFNYTQALALYLGAIMEDPAGTRTITLDGVNWAQYTNAQVVELSRTALDTAQIIQEALQLVAQDIQNGIVTDAAGLDAAYTNYATTYVSTRTRLPLYSELVAQVRALQTAVAALQP